MKVESIARPPPLWRPQLIPGGTTDPPSQISHAPRTRRRGSTRTQSSSRLGCCCNRAPFTVRHLSPRPRRGVMEYSCQAYIGIDGSMKHVTEGRRGMGGSKLTGRSWRVEFGESMAIQLVLMFFLKVFSGHVFSGDALLGMFFWRCSFGDVLLEMFFWRCSFGDVLLEMFFWRCFF